MSRALSNLTYHQRARLKSGTPYGDILCSTMPHSVKTEKKLHGNFFPQSCRASLDPMWHFVRSVKQPNCAAQFGKTTPYPLGWENDRKDYEQMKETTRTSRTAGYLEKIFRALNADWWGGELEEPIITIQSTPRAYGHVTVAKTWKKKDENRHELNIGAETLNRPIENVVATMMHEMVHLYNLAHGVQDCSRGGIYHNRKFRDLAVTKGLDIQKHETYGWTLTQPTDELMEYILDKGWSEVMMNRGGTWTPPTNIGGKAGNGGTAITPPKAKSSTRKYQCPCCGNSVRATKTVNILCGDCMQTMEIVS